jgi:hypothetical protein
LPAARAYEAHRGPASAQEKVRVAKEMAAAHPDEADKWNAEAEAAEKETFAA